MSKVTSKLQVTVPKSIAQVFDIHAGDEIDWVGADDVIRVVPARLRSKPRDVAMRLKLFDQATARQKRRERKPRKPAAVTDRGWKREDLYRRGRAR